MRRNLQERVERIKLEVMREVIQPQFQLISKIVRVFRGETSSDGVKFLEDAAYDHGW
jgi:hypothetical protein